MKYFSKNMRPLAFGSVIILAVFTFSYANAAIGRAKNFNLTATISGNDGSALVATTPGGISVTIDAANAQITKNGKKNLEVSALVPGDHVTIAGKILPDGTYLAQSIRTIKGAVKLSAKQHTAKKASRKATPKKVVHKISANSKK